MVDSIIPDELSSKNFGVREELASFLISFIEHQGGFYVLYNQEGIALLSSNKLPSGLIDFIKEMLNFKLPKKTISKVFNRHKATSYNGYSLSLNEVYHQDEMCLLLVGVPEKTLVNELYNAFPVGVMKVDNTWNLKYCNAHCHNLLGLATDELVGKTWLSCFGNDTSSTIFEYFSNPRESHDSLRLISQIITPLGRARMVSIAINEQFDLLGELVSYYVMLQDITTEYNESNYLKHLATHDHLTQLKNRSALLDDIQLLYTSQEYINCALLFIDLDKFKFINDNYGHNTGDELLKVVAKRLLHITRTDDIVARIGGDEFIVVLNNIQSEDAAFKRALSIKESLNQPTFINQQKLPINLSIGLAHGQSLKAIIPNDIKPEQFAEHWLGASDSAMYHAKSDSMNGIMLYTQDLASKLAHSLEVQTEIEKLISGANLETYFQPIFGLKGVYSLEALTRFNAACLANIENTFDQIRKQKNSRLILLRIIEINVQTYTALYEKYADRTPNLNINTDLSLMHDSSFSEFLFKLLKANQIPPNKIFVELTEKDTSSQIHENVYLNIKNLKNRGIRISLDDFGSGYSSIERVIKLGFDQMKIDKVLLSDKLSIKQKVSALTASVNLGEALGLEVLLEGIENVQDANLASKCLIHLKQGYFYSKPMSLKQTLEFLRSNHGN